jgi:Uma2 family endonuclease
MSEMSVVGASEPTWEIARLFPHQGAWSEEEYLELPTNRLVEFSHGYIEVLPMPTESHQLIVLFLYRTLLSFVQNAALGIVLVAPMRVRLRSGKYREPDIIFLLVEHAKRRHELYWDTPDLVMEVVSKENRQHDLEIKRREYAQAGIPEYWIVDPEEERITVLALKERRYLQQGVYSRGEIVRSVFLPGFEVGVDEVWAAAEE